MAGTCNRQRIRHKKQLTFQIEHEKGSLLLFPLTGMAASSSNETSETLPKGLAPDDIKTPGRTGDTRAWVRSIGMIE